MLLKIGSQGLNVNKVQTKLGLPATGIFDTELHAAVMHWQFKNGLTSDGVIGDATWNSMFPAVASGGIPVGQMAILSSSNKTTSYAGRIILEKLARLVDVLPAHIFTEITANVEKLNLTTDLQLAHFLAQCIVESGNFKFTVEDLNYSEMQLSKYFDKHFTAGEISEYAHEPEKIANRVYANRMGNGTEASGDGWRYRGRGYIQITGKAAYDLFGKLLKVDLIANPELLATTYPLLSANQFFTNKGLWAICNKGSNPVDVAAVTKVINGGANLLQERVTAFNKYYKLLQS